MKQQLEKLRKERQAAGKPTEDKEEDKNGTEEEGGEDVEMEVKEAPADAEVKEEPADVKPANDESGESTEEEDSNVPLKKKYGLEEVQRLAEVEFQRRSTQMDDSLDDLTLRPWGFPRGGFRHQVNSTSGEMNCMTDDCVSFIDVFDKTGKQ